MSRNPKFEKTLQLMKELHDKKNEDYSENGPYDNFELVAGITTGSIDDAFRIHVANKLARAKSLLNKDKEAHFESLQDTLLDLAIYSTMWFSYHIEEES